MIGAHYVRKRLDGGKSRWYVYAWRGGPQIMWSDGMAKPKLTRTAVSAAASALRTRDRERQAPDPALLLSLIRSWRSEDPARPSSPEWERLAKNTKATWGLSLNKIEDRWGRVPLEVFNDGRMIAKVVAWRDSMAATPRAADIGINVLRALLQFGMHRGVLSRNVAAGIGKLYVDGQRAEIVWSEADLVLFRKVAGEQDARVADAVDLASVTGLRRADVARLTWNEVGEFAIVRRAAKASKGRRRFASIPRIPELDAVMDRLRLVPRTHGVDTLLVTSAGVPWELNLLSKHVGRLIRKAEIVHIDADTGERRFKHLHDVRGTFATRLMTGPKLTNEEVAGIMGWSPNEVERIRRIYVDDTARTVALDQRIARKCKPKL